MTLPSDSSRIEIEFHDAEPHAASGGTSERPSAQLQGRIPAGAVPVYIDTAVIESVWRHVMTNRRTELGGILIGRCAQNGDLFARITACLDARHTTTTAGSLTFTHETWADLADRVGERYGDQKVLGWYHSHPGHGVFMSRYDRFIHESFFRNPWQCALVLDPVRGEEGLFQSVDGRIVRSGYWAVPVAPAARAVDRASLVIDVVPEEQETFAEALEQAVEEIEQVVRSLPALLYYGVGASIEGWRPPGGHFDDKA